MTAIQIFSRVQTFTAFRREMLKRGKTELQIDYAWHILKLRAALKVSV